MHWQLPKILYGTPLVTWNGFSSGEGWNSTVQGLLEPGVAGIREGEHAAWSRVSAALGDVFGQDREHLVYPRPVIWDCGRFGCKV